MMIKIVCIKDTVNSIGILIKSGEILYMNEEQLNYKDISSMAVWGLKDHRDHKNYFIIGYYNIVDFITLDKWREKQINKILNT